MIIGYLDPWGKRDIQHVIGFGFPGLSSDLPCFFVFSLGGVFSATWPWSPGGRSLSKAGLLLIGL